MNTKKIPQFGEALYTTDHGKATRTSAISTHTLTASLSPTDCTEAQIGGKVLLCRKGAALASRLLTNDPIKRQQLYSPSRKRMPAYCTHGDSFNCIATKFRAGPEIGGLIPSGNRNSCFQHRVHARCGRPLFPFQSGLGTLSPEMRSWLLAPIQCQSYKAHAAIPKLFHGVIIKGRGQFTFCLYRFQCHRYASAQTICLLQTARATAMAMNFYRTTGLNIPECTTLHSHSVIISNVTHFIAYYAYYRLRCIYAVITCYKKHEWRSTEAALLLIMSAVQKMYRIAIISVVRSRESSLQPPELC
jgi:hypothetical protein